MRSTHALLEVVSLNAPLVSVFASSASAEVRAALPEKSALVFAVRLHRFVLASAPIFSLAVSEPARRDKAPNVPAVFPEKRPVAQHTLVVRFGI